MSLRIRQGGVSLSGFTDGGALMMVTRASAESESDVAENPNAAMGPDMLTDQEVVDRTSSKNSVRTVNILPLTDMAPPATSDGILTDMPL